MNSARHVLLVAMVLALGVVACSHSDKSTSSSTTTTVAATGTTTSTTVVASTKTFCDAVKKSSIASPPDPVNIVTPNDLKAFQLKMAAYTIGVDKLAATAPTAVRPDATTLATLVDDLNKVVQAAPTVAELTKTFPAAQRSASDAGVAVSGAAVGQYVRSHC